MTVLGSGILLDPYQIATQSDLDEIANDPTACYIIMADIELVGEWTPLPSFTGTLDGNGCTISGLQFTKTDSGYSGFFSELGVNAAVRNLIIATTAQGIAATNDNYIGVLAGNVQGGVNLYRVGTLGKVTASQRAGGFIGRYQSTSGYLSGHIRECFAFVDLSSSGTSNVGGFAGYVYSTWEFRACVSSDTYAGRAAGVSVTNVSTPSAQASYPTSWDFGHVWEMGASFPQFKPAPPAVSRAVSFDLPDSEIETSVTATVNVDSAPASRRVVLISNETLSIDTPDGVKVWPVVVGYGVTDEYGALELDLMNYGGEVFAVALDDWPTVWQPSEAYQIGDLRRPSEFAGVVYECVGAGSGGGTEPEWWPYSDGNNTGSVGTAVFRARRYYRPLAHGPITPAAATP